MQDSPEEHIVLAFHFDHLVLHVPHSLLHDGQLSINWCILIVDVDNFLSPTSQRFAHEGSPHMHIRLEPLMRVDLLSNKPFGPELLFAHAFYPQHLCPPMLGCYPLLLQCLNAQITRCPEALDLNGISRVVPDRPQTILRLRAENQNRNDQAYSEPQSPPRLHPSLTEHWSFLSISFDDFAFSLSCGFVLLNTNHCSKAMLLLSQG
mmetsp:Transcript_39354/g.61345  ORF Transcript_39354/g.61345 Transcript_39354/m.61345 type:complete len:206 (+) Transcript_39354:732-1349(+)